MPIKAKDALELHFRRERERQNNLYPKISKLSKDNSESLSLLHKNLASKGALSALINMQEAKKRGSSTSSIPTLEEMFIIEALKADNKKLLNCADEDLCRARANKMTELFLRSLQPGEMAGDFTFISEIEAKALGFTDANAFINSFINEFVVQIVPDIIAVVNAAIKQSTESELATERDKILICLSSIHKQNLQDGIAELEQLKIEKLTTKKEVALNTIPTGMKATPKIDRTEHKTKYLDALNINSRVMGFGEYSILTNFNILLSSTKVAYNPKIQYSPDGNPNTPLIAIDLIDLGNSDDASVQTAQENNQANPREVARIISEIKPTDANIAAAIIKLQNETTSYEQTVEQKHTDQLSALISLASTGELAKALAQTDNPKLADVITELDKLINSYDAAAAQTKDLFINIREIAVAIDAENKAIARVQTAITEANNVLSTLNTQVVQNTALLKGDASQPALIASCATKSQTTLTDTDKLHSKGIYAAQTMANLVKEAKIAAGKLTTDDGAGIGGGAPPAPLPAPLTDAITATSDAVETECTGAATALKNAQIARVKAQNALNQHLTVQKNKDKLDRKIIKFGNPNAATPAEKGGVHNTIERALYETERLRLLNALHEENIQNLQQARAALPTLVTADTAEKDKLAALNTKIVGLETAVRTAQQALTDLETQQRESNAGMVAGTTFLAGLAAGTAAHLTTAASNILPTKVKPFATPIAVALGAAAALLATSGYISYDNTTTLQQFKDAVAKAQRDLDSAKAEKTTLETPTTGALAIAAKNLKDEQDKIAELEKLTTDRPIVAPKDKIDVNAANKPILDITLKGVDDDTKSEDTCGFLFGEMIYLKDDNTMGDDADALNNINRLFMGYNLDGSKLDDAAFTALKHDSGTGIVTDALNKDDEIKRMHPGKKLVCVIDPDTNISQLRWAKIEGGELRQLSNPTRKDFNTILNKGWGILIKTAGYKDLEKRYQIFASTAKLATSPQPGIDAANTTADRPARVIAYCGR